MGTIRSYQYELVKKFYEDDGLSAREISEKLQVSIDAVYYFLRHQKIPRRKSEETNRLRFERKKASFFPLKSLNRKQEILRTVALALYWAEGSKGEKTVDFTNSNETMCLIFLKFLREICRVDEQRIHGYIYSHENKDPQKLVSYWSQLTGIPRSNFSKPYIKQINRKAQTHHPERMPNGLLHIRYSDRKFIRQILRWIKEESTIWVGSEVVKRTRL